MKYLLLLITLMAFSATDAREKYYKWTDADGTIHYSQKKPPKTNASEVKIHDSVSTSTQTKQAENTEAVKSPEEKEVDAYNQAQKDAIKKIQDNANCKIAKKNLAELQKTVRVRRKDPKTGEYVLMDDDQRVQMLALAKKSIKDLCK